MVNFMKKLFRSTPLRGKRLTEPVFIDGPGYFDVPPALSHREALRKQWDEGIERVGQDSRFAVAPDETVTPFPRPEGSWKGKGKATANAKPIDEANGGQWNNAMRALADLFRITDSILPEPSSDSLMACLLSQQAFLLELSPFAQERDLPCLDNLRDLYRATLTTVCDIPSMEAHEGSNAEIGLTRMLAENGALILDVALIETIVWFADVVNEKAGQSIWQGLQDAFAEQDSLLEFRSLAGGIVIQTTELASSRAKDQVEKNARHALLRLAEMLQDRLTSPAVPIAIETRPEPGRPKSGSTLTSPADSRSTSPDPDYKSYDGKALENAFGTGPMPSPMPSVPPSIAQKNARPSSPVESVASEESIWEYRGQRMTRSALSLVLRQEHLAFADSSGQYAGQVEWDEVRNAWIPEWAEPLRAEDLADGEVPITNPADFKVKKTDAWGNKIGWREGIMFYVEEPQFFLRD